MIAPDGCCSSNSTEHVTIGRYLYMRAGWCYMGVLNARRDDGLEGSLSKGSLIFIYKAF